MSNQNLIAILQASLTPVVLISGVGLLLLSMTNRLSRPLDRIRFLGKELKTSSQKDQSYYLRQIQIFYKRTFLLQKAITASSLSIICASLIVLFLFLMVTFSLNFNILIIFVFITGLLTLILSMVFFLCDIQASLKSVEIEMQRLKSNYPEIKMEK